MLRLRHYFLLVLLVFVGVAKSQNYPVQTFVQVSPPHTSYLPDYADPFSNQMKVLLTFTDFSYPSYNVKLRFKFEGNGYTITSGSLLPLPLFTITPGVPYEISGNDLAPYLATSNLVFSGINVSDYQTRKVLPEGPVTICVEVVDFSNPNQAILSNPSCTPVWFSLNDPPLLNTPFCGNLITPTDPQQLIFSWTPLHMNSINSAGTNYVFELFEIRPDNADPNQVVNSTLPIFMQVTDQTYINYGIVEPQLQVGMSYVWRVRAQDIAGRDFFRNNGYSAVCTFTYGNVAASLADGITLTLNSNGTGVRQGLAWWNASSTFTNYKVEVRKTGDPNYEWFPYDATSGDLKINGLEPNTNYECRVKGLIGVDYESEWSNTSTFKTQAAPDYACGSTSLPGKSQVIVPLTNAIAGLYFTVGQFEMQVKSIEPVNAITMPGHYKGLGTIQIPFALLNLRVKFDDILVDENLMVRSGKVEAITQGIDAWLEGLEAVDPEFVDGVITDFSWNDSTSLTVWLDGEPQEFIFPESGVLVLQDEDGMKYTFHANGTVTFVSTLIYGDDVLAGNKDYRINFSADANQVFGFDQKKYAAWLAKYEVLLLTDSTNYFVPFKSLGVNEQDVVQANIKSLEVLNGVTFISDRNGVISNLNATQLNDTTYQVTLANINENSFVYAVHQGNRIGKLWVKALPKIEKEIVVVPVNGATLTNVNALTADLNKIYAQANVSLTVTVATNFQNSDWDLNNDNKLQNGDVTLMSHYSEEMRAQRDFYFESDTAYNKKAYYLFVVPQFLNADLDGYMVRGKAVGFLKNGADAHTAAHELAHGIFNLEHTFPEVTQGITNNLLDYTENSTNKSHLAQHQWELIHKPLPAFSFLDGEEDGSQYGDPGTAITKICKPYARAQINTRHIFVAPDGSLVDLSRLNGAVANAFYNSNEINPNAIGTLSGFIYQDKQYVTLYSSDSAQAAKEFIGYAHKPDVGVLQKLLPEDFEANENITSADATLCVIKCDEQKLYFLNIDGSDQGYPTDLSCNNCSPLFSNRFFEESTHSVSLVTAYIESVGSVSKSYFGPNGPMLSLVTPEVFSSAYSDFIEDPILIDRLKSFSVHNSGRKIYIAPIFVDVISRNEEDWHYFAKTVFDNNYFKENDILITIPYTKIDYANNEPVYYYMPGLAYGNSVKFDQSSLEALTFTNTLKASSFVNERHGSIIEFINHVFKFLMKSVTVYEGVLNPNGSVSFSTYKSNEIAGFEQSTYITLYTNDAIIDIIGYYEAYKGALSSCTEFVDGVLVTIPGCAVAAEATFRNNTLNALALSDESSTSQFVPNSQNNYLFKDEFLDSIIAMEYIFHKAFLQYFSALSSLDMGDFPISYNSPPGEYTWNQNAGGRVWFDDVVYNSLDIIGISLGFFGLDVITDGLGFIYANVRGDQFNSAVYASSIFIVGVPTIATKQVSKEIIEGGSKMILRKNGNELILEPFDQVIHGIRSKYKVNGSLTNQEVLNLKELESAGKITSQKHLEIKNAFDNPQLQRQIILELSEDLDVYTLLNWDITTKNLFEADLNSTEGISFKNFFESAENIYEQKKIAEAWKLIRESIPLQNGTTQFAKDPNTLNKVVEMMQEGSGFRNALGNTWLDELTIIINKNDVLPCETCGSPSGYTVARHNMDKFLDQVEFFVMHYDINGTGKKMYNWLKRLGVDGVTPMNAHGNIEELYQTLYHLKSQNITSVVDFGKKFPFGTKEYDLFFGGKKYTELKNVDYTSSGLSIETQDQLIFGYFANIDNINDLQWIAHFKKLQAGGWSSISLAETNLKNMWKSVFVSRTEEIFEANPELWMKFQKIGGGNIENLSDFENLLSHSSFNINHPIFNFIKVQ